MDRTITIKGTGNLKIKPDYIQLNFSLVSKNFQYERAMNIASESLEKLYNAIINVGFEKDDVKTRYFDVSTDYDSVKDKYGNYKKVFRGYKVNHKLILSFDYDMKKLSNALIAISTSLSDPDLSIDFTIKDSEKAKYDLLKEVAIDARKKAEILCEASGYKLGDLIKIDYDWSEITIFSNTKFSMLREQSIMTASKSIDMNPEDIDLEDTATFVWEIK
ncbi:MAG: SIMPL domain-containing protein [Helcococcus sp.]|nr:SIMPL domain-containing protein [Helcococcus sp.]